MAILQFNTKVHFGHGSRAQLTAEMQVQGMKRPLFVTDKGVVAAGVFAMATAALDAIAQAAVFDATPPNPTEDAAEAGLALYHAQGCDGIVGIGGGATLDLAKAIAVLCGDPAPLWEYCNRHAQPRPIVNPPPLILLPTTAGSGSEVGRSAVVIFRNGIKAGVGCPSIVKAAICHHHGTLNAIMLPHVLAYNAAALAEKMPVMREAMGLPAGADLPAAFAALNRRLGLPPGLSALGIDESVFPAIAAASLLDNAHRTNPRALSGEDYIALLNAAR